MATIQIKRRASGGASGAPASLAVGEPAYSEVDNILYIGVTGGTVLSMGGTGAFCTLTSTQTVSGAKTFSGTCAFSGTVTAVTQTAGTNNTTVATTAFVLGQGFLTSSSTLNSLSAATGNYSMGSNRLTNVADPVNAQDVCTKNYADNLALGLDFKASCRVATTANITLSGTQTIDGVAVVAGDRVLVKNQTTASANGIYVVAAGAWSRSTDADSSAEVTSGLFVFIEEGTTHADQAWVLTTNNPVTLGTTALTFAQFSGGSGTGSTSIVTLGTVTTGTWNATTIGVAYGGTGATTLTGILKGNGTSAFTAATAGTDYQAAITASGLLKGAGAGSVSAATAGTDYQAAITASGLLKGAGGGSVSAAVAGTDYLAPASTVDGGTY